MAFELVFSEQTKDDIDFFKKAGNIQVLKKLKSLLVELSIHPDEGTGRPEQLKHNLSGYWSRRITEEHRLVYEISGEQVHILSVRGHY